MASQKQLDALARGRATRDANRKKKLDEVLGLNTSSSSGSVLSSSSASASQGTDGVQLGETVASVPGAIEVEVRAEAPPAKKPSLKERFLNRAQSYAQPQKGAPRRKPTNRKKDAGDNLLPALANVVASLVAMYSRQLLPDDYKACAPSENEVGGMLNPIMSIIGRRVEVTGQISEDMNDILSALVCALAYSTRAAVTYMDIKRDKEQPGHAEKKAAIREYESVTSGSDTSLSGGLRAYQTANPGLDRDANSESASNGYATTATSHAQYDGADTDNDPEQDRELEARQVASLFSRDKRGRVQLGLLPRTV